MSLTTSREPVLEAGESEFLKRHDAEAAFQTVCELVRTYFPELRAINVWLLEDPDEDDHTWAVVHVFMPAAYSQEVLQEQLRRYHKELVKRLPFKYLPLFGLMTDFWRE